MFNPSTPIQYRCKHTHVKFTSVDDEKYSGHKRPRLINSCFESIKILGDTTAKILKFSEASNAFEVSENQVESLENLLKKRKVTHFVDLVPTGRS